MSIQHGNRQLKQSAVVHPSGQLVRIVQSLRAHSNVRQLLNFKIHPQISRIRRQSAVEQTSDLLKAYLEHAPDPFAPCDESERSDAQSSALAAGFIVPKRHSA